MGIRAGDRKIARQQAGVGLLAGACSVVLTGCALLGALVGPVEPRRDPVLRDFRVEADLYPSSRPETPVTAPTPGIVEKIAPKTGASLKGAASWYCSVSKPICHYQWPPGSMVAAACAPLRAALGSGWRGQTVVIQYGEAKVTVRLVDWCGHKTRLIDLYAEPFSRLAPISTGVLRGVMVNVR